jgi:hypothetical protein
MRGELVPMPTAASVALRLADDVPVLITAAGEQASMRFLEFFAANIRNPHTRRAYARAAEEFLAWCADAGVPSIGAVQPVHVATWIGIGNTRARRAECQATARRNSSPVRLAGDRPGRAGQPGGLGSRIALGAAGFSCAAQQPTVCKGVDS